MTPKVTNMMLQNTTYCGWFITILIYLQKIGGIAAFELRKLCSSLTNLVHTNHAKKIMGLIQLEEDPVENLT